MIDEARVRENAATGFDFELSWHRPPDYPAATDSLIFVQVVMVSSIGDPLDLINTSNTFLRVFQRIFPLFHGCRRTPSLKACNAPRSLYSSRPFGHGCESSECPRSVRDAVFAVRYVCEVDCGGRSGAGVLTLCPCLDRGLWRLHRGMVSHSHQRFLPLIDASVHRSHNCP